MLRIAHRGAKGYAPENTISAFRKAFELNADGIEFDVHLTADNRVVIIHDHTLDRTTSGIGEVRIMTLAELKKLEPDHNLQIPELSETLDFLAGKCLVNIEIKVEAAALPVIDIIEKRIAGKQSGYEDFLVSSFDWTALKEIRTRNPRIPLCVLTATDLDLAISFAAFVKAETIHPYFQLLTKEYVDSMQRSGLRVFTWTVNEPDDIARMKSYGVDGIISDYPDRL